MWWLPCTLPLPGRPLPLNLAVLCCALRCACLTTQHVQQATDQALSQDDQVSYSQQLCGRGPHTSHSQPLPSPRSYGPQVEVQRQRGTPALLLAATPRPNPRPTSLGPSCPSCPRGR